MYVQGKDLTPISLMELFDNKGAYNENFEFFLGISVITNAYYYPFIRDFENGTFEIASDYKILFDEQDGPKAFVSEEGPFISTTKEKLLNKIERWRELDGVLVYQFYCPVDPDPEVYKKLRKMYGAETRTILGLIMGDSKLPRIIDKWTIRIEEERWFDRNFGTES